MASNTEGKKETCKICGCESAEWKTVPERFEYKGKELIVPDYRVLYCDLCNDGQVDKESSKRAGEMIAEFQKSVDSPIRKIKEFIRRLKAIGVSLEFAANYPQIYLDKVNGKQVIEKFQARHGYTAFILKTDGSLKFSDRREVFKKIREMLNATEVVKVERDPDKPLPRTNKPCMGTTDYWGELGCESDVDCEKCTCNGGDFDPETGEEIKGDSI